MAFWKRRTAYTKKSLVRPGLKGFQPRLEMLEDRFQPSLTGLPVDGIEAHPTTGFHHMDFAAQSTVATGVTNMLSQTAATYITGTTGSATARGIALGNDGSTYVTGTITVNGQEEGYVAKYDSSGKQAFLFTFQAIDVTAPDITFANTEGHAIAVDSVGNSYVAGTAIDTASGFHNAYTLKISADGTAIIWGDALGDAATAADSSLTTGDGIAVKDPNKDGNGLAVMTGSLTITNPADGPVGDHLFVVRWSADGTDVAPGDHDSQGNGFYFYYTFGPNDQGTHGRAFALNNSSTASAPGSLGYIAGDINISGVQAAFAFQISNGDGQQSGLAAAALRGTATTDVLTYTGVAVNPDDTSVFSGKAVSGSTSTGIVVGYAAPIAPPALFMTGLQNASSLNAIAVDSAGNIYVTGAAANPANGGVYVASLDNGGNLVSELTFGGTGSVDSGYGIVARSSGSLAVIGDTTSSSLSTDGTTLNGTQDAFFATLAP